MTKNLKKILVFGRIKQCLSAVPGTFFQIMVAPHESNATSNSTFKVSPTQAASGTAGVIISASPWSRAPGSAACMHA